MAEEIRGLTESEARERRPTPPAMPCNYLQHTTQGTRSWDSSLLLTNPRCCDRRLSVFTGFAGKTKSRLEPLTCSLRVITQALQGCAGACKYRIFRGGSFPCFALCCTVLRSRWYQSGIRCPRIACRRFLRAFSKLDARDAETASGKGRDFFGPPPPTDPFRPRPSFPLTPSPQGPRR